MARVTIPAVVADEARRASWASAVKGNDEDHETRIVTLETAVPTDAAQVLVASGEVNNTDFKALQTTYQQAVAAPGANKTWIFHMGAFYLNATAGAYTNITAGDIGGLAFVFGNWESDASTFWTIPDTASGTSAVLTPFAPVPTTALLASGPPPYPPKAGNGGAINKALKIAVWNDAGDLTGGHASNSLKWRVWYSLWDLS